MRLEGTQTQPQKLHSCRESMGKTSGKCLILHRNLLCFQVITVLFAFLWSVTFFTEETNVFPILISYLMVTLYTVFLHLAYIRV